MNESEKVNAFLEELTALTKKYKIIVWGCGCCDSPCLDVVHPSANILELTRFSDKFKYEVDEEHGNLSWIKE